MNNPLHAPLIGTYNRSSRGGHQEKKEKNQTQLTGFQRKGFLATSLSREWCEQHCFSAAALSLGGPGDGAEPRPGFGLLLPVHD